MTTTYETRVTRIHVAPKGEPLFSEMGFAVEIQDDGGGEFVVLRGQASSTSDATQEVRIDPDDWPSLRAAINNMISECRPESP
jgi:hypothetical protein